jgi:hypothetical protein
MGNAMTCKDNIGFVDENTLDEYKDAVKKAREFVDEKTGEKSDLHLIFLQNLLIGDVIGIRSYESNTLPFNVTLSSGVEMKCDKFARINDDDLWKIKKQMNARTKMLDFGFGEYNELPFPVVDTLPANHPLFLPINKRENAFAMWDDENNIYRKQTKSSKYSEGGRKQTKSSKYSEGGSEGGVEDTIVSGIPNNILFFILACVVIYMLMNPNKNSGVNKSYEQNNAVDANIPNSSQTLY